jgi:predicted outer membrane protein
MYPNQPPQQAPSPEPIPPQAPAPVPSPVTYVGQPSTPTNLPTDYLNQIAPQAPKRPPFSFGIKQLLIIGAALVVLVIILAVVVGNIANSKKDPLEHLSARLTATQAVVTDAQINLKSSELRSLNSNLNIYMTNTNRDITAPLTAAGINTKKLSTSIVASESTTALSARLENARLNAVYDSTYAREMAYQLGTLMTLMNQIYKSTSNASLKTFLQSAYENLKPTQASFANFTATD